MKKVSQIRISKRSTWLYFWIEDTLYPKGGIWPRDIRKWKHNSLYHQCLECLRKIGFTVTKDPRIEKDYKILSKFHMYGEWKSLEVDIEIYEAGFKFEFYQNLNTGDRVPGHGKHCFDKWKLMDYLMQKRFEYVVNRLRMLIENSFETILELVDRQILAEAAILNHVQNNHWRSGNATSLCEIAGTDRVSSYDLSYNFVDRDKKPIRSGDIKYLRINGRLMRAQVFHNINNMWWILLDKYQYTNEACFRLFDPTPEDFANRRVKEGKIPEAKAK